MFLLAVKYVKDRLSHQFQVHASRGLASAADHIVVPAMTNIDVLQ
jgi:hypothetical protein